MEVKKYRLRELISIKNGSDHKRLKDGVIPVYGSGGIMRYVDTPIYDKESVLLPRKGTLDNIQYVNEPFWTVDTIYYTEIDKTKILPYFLYRYLSLLDLSGLDSGTGVPSMTFDAYYNIEIKIPSIDIQTKVSKLLKSLDDKIALNNRINSKLEQMAKRLYDYWFVQFDFPGADGKPYKSNGGKMVWNEELKREIPEGWEVKKISDFCRIFTGKKDVNQALSNGKYKFFSCAPGWKYSNEKLFEGKAILISGNGSYTGRTIFVNDAFDLYQRTYACVSKSETTILEFIYFHMLRFLSLKVSGGTHGSAIPYIVYDDIAEEKIPYEKIICDDFFEKVNPLLEEKAKLQEENLKLTLMRDKLLPLLMNGQVVVD